MRPVTIDRVGTGRVSECVSMRGACRDPIGATSRIVKKTPMHVTPQRGPALLESKAEPASRLRQGAALPMCLRAGQLVQTDAVRHQGGPPLPRRAWRVPRTLLWRHQGLA